MPGSLVPIAPTRLLKMQPCRHPTTGKPRIIAANRGCPDNMKTTVLTDRMTDRDLRVVRLPAQAWDALSRESQQGRPFRYVVDATRFTPTWRLALVTVGTDVAGAAAVRRKGHPGRGQDGLDFKHAEQFAAVVPWQRLSSGVPVRLREHLERKDGEAFPPKTAAALEAELIRTTPDAADALQRIRTALRPQPRSAVESRIREQRDAAALGLEIAGMDSRAHLGSYVEEPGVPFLAGLRRRKVSEAAHLRHDSTVFDDWLPQYAGHFDIATFRDPDDSARQVTVIYADKEDIERQTGTDLIYYRHHHPGFILVQYKRMRADPTGRSKPAYYPDAQLSIELRRLRDLPAPGDPNGVEDWRLTDNVTFFKLVRDDLNRPDENRLAWGMYIPLGLAELLLQDAERGRCRRGWSQESITTYLSNREFLHLAKQGYIGSRGATTEHLEQTIRSSLEGGAGLVLAVDQTDPTRARRLPHG